MDASKSVSDDHKMRDTLDNFFKTYELSNEPDIAVGLSGGPDSMALCRLLSAHVEEHKVKINMHALIVDHDLREESACEAEETFARVKNWPHVTPVILKCAYDGDVESAWMQVARDARYAKFYDYCSAHAIKSLFLGHHQDDQAETFLFRLAKGSGLDGLSSMARTQSYKQTELKLCRPFLGVAKADLVEFCDDHGVEYIDDPSNEKTQFARPRLRKSMSVLEEEGLSSKRLAVTAMRLRRAREALEVLSERAFGDICLEKSAKYVVLQAQRFQEAMEEIALRVIVQAIQHLNPGADYLPRMEKIEDLSTALQNTNSFRKRTLGGLIFSRNDTDHKIKIEKEK